MINYSFTKSADKQLRKLPSATQKKIVEKLKTYLSHNKPLDFAKRLSGITGKVYRYRFGTYRLVFEIISPTEILVLMVGHRKDIYK